MNIKRVKNENNRQRKGESVNSKKRPDIKRQVIALKYMHLFLRFNHLLLFHYNKQQECNWQQVKEKLGAPWGTECQSLFVPNNLFHYLENNFCQGDVSTPHSHLHQLRQLTRGPTLLVTCSEISQMATIVDTWKGSDFLLIGGMSNGQILSHLDIKRWVSLHKDAVQPHYALLQPLTQGQALYSLLQISGELRQISYPLHRLMESLHYITSTAAGFHQR